ncbi:MAG: hypothetical protein IPK19_20815 [Chloroflexi bacterium]|nr:hypothetical protein [Chloroflexota bacterium]
MAISSKGGGGAQGGTLSLTRQALTLGQQFGRQRPLVWLAKSCPGSGPAEEKQRRS